MEPCSTSSLPSAPALDQHLLDFGDCLSGIQTLGTSSRTIQNGVASIESERILEFIEPLTSRLVAAIDKPAGCLKQNCGTEKTIAVPPVTRTSRGAAKT
jgi:hypothetical protein